MGNAWQVAYVLRDVVTAPGTFSRPKPVPTADAPALNATAPTLPAIRPGRPAVIAFLRHVGCPFAETTVRRLVNMAPAHPTIGFIAVTHSPRDRSLRWCEGFGGVGSVGIVADPHRQHYGTWGVGLSDREHFAGRDALAALRRLASGVHNRRASGTRWQAAATFAVDGAMVIRWRHLPRHAGDLPALQDAVAALDPAATSA